MKPTDLAKIFLRSLLIQSSLNFRRMQNMGFAYSVLPMKKSREWKNGEWADFLRRHVQLFNTHPYLSAPILGSVVKAEEAPASERAGEAVLQLKKTLMAPYAAIGDAFFWGTWRPFAAIVAVFLALMDLCFSPVVFVLLYNSLHLWVRGRGFLEGYRSGNGGLQFVQALNLPAMNAKIRWLSLGAMAVLMAWWLEAEHPFSPGVATALIAAGMVLLLILLSIWAISKHISPVWQFYALAVVFFLISL
jgi:mannose PTS system EIID component